MFSVGTFFVEWSPFLVDTQSGFRYANQRNDDLTCGKVWRREQSKLETRNRSEIHQTTDKICSCSTCHARPGWESQCFSAQRQWKQCQYQNHHRCSEIRRCELGRRRISRRYDFDSHRRSVYILKQQNIIYEHRWMNSFLLIDPMFVRCMAFFDASCLLCVFFWFLYFFGIQVTVPRL